LRRLAAREQRKLLALSDFKEFELTTKSEAQNPQKLPGLLLLRATLAPQNLWS